MREVDKTERWYQWYADSSYQHQLTPPDNGRQHRSCNDFRPYMHTKWIAANIEANQITIILWWTGHKNMLSQAHVHRNTARTSCLMSSNCGRGAQFLSTCFLVHTPATHLWDWATNLVSTDRSYNHRSWKGFHKGKLRKSKTNVSWVHIARVLLSERITQHTLKSEERFRYTRDPLASTTQGIYCKHIELSNTSC